ncbi:MAG: alpha-mannosidase [Gemmatimonadetes bacterium]|jgi:alpha-mannosidase|nr:alpha-mannosidase [Gemmatimonadota bacterium]MBT6150193.1 alpha-mannosidase [Gemmatimonadota bacterium]MBT7863279.1 alpha-mannosidase [Gemmatimonadota bacterium]
MPRIAAYTTGQLDATLARLGEARYRPLVGLDVEAWLTSEPVSYAHRRTGEHLRLGPGDTWGELFDCAWFHFTGIVPAAAAGEHVALLLDVHGEMLIVDDEGNPHRGLTTVTSVFDMSLGAPGKRMLSLHDPAAGGDAIDVWADAGCNDLFGNLQGNGTLKEARIVTVRSEVRALYYDMEVLLDLLRCLPQDSPTYRQLRAALTEVAHLVVAADPQMISEAAILESRALLAPHLQRHGGDPALHISAVGHAHMDLAWLWPLRETIRKGARTFSTALDLIDRYPGYVFGASQPQYFAWMKSEYPVLYERIRAAVADGRIEPQGAMWVEADTNISGGEALVRQILLGRRFWQAEFNVDVDHLWLPDVFGYSAALPQIMRQAGIDTFATQKLSWSLINRFPHHSFQWEGVDGSVVIAHMFPEDTYNGPALPRSVRKIETDYADADVSDHALMVFGIGDGGGGPGSEHLERLHRIRDLAGLSPVRPSSAADFFQRWREDAPNFARWVGELYLERHQGTLTTQAAVKRGNRKMEKALRELEMLALIVECQLGRPYPRQDLQAWWEETLLYQFHDILPGSSIKRVYDECIPRYEQMLSQVKAQIKKCLEALAAHVDSGNIIEPVLVFNSLPWARTESIRTAAGVVSVSVPSCGYAVVSGQPTSAHPALKASPTSLENDCILASFDDGGRLTRLVHKQSDRQILAPESVGNDLVMFPDLGDAWDFPMDYHDLPTQHLRRIHAEARVEGDRAILEQRFEFGHSWLTQRIVLTAGSPRLDFHCQAQWRETSTMLRVRFPVDVRAQEASYDLQIGHLFRPTHGNTTWDLARDEVAAHHWADLSTSTHGVALLNDCKYGHRVKDHTLDLNLIRSVPHPGPRRIEDDQVQPGEPHGHYTDQRDHTFTYALWPHEGDVVEGGVDRAGHELNSPVQWVAAPTGPGSAPSSGTSVPGLSWLRIETEDGDAGGDRGATGTHTSASGAAGGAIILEAVKKAEEGDDWIVRLCEANGRAVTVSLYIDLPVAGIEQVDLMEQSLESLQVEAPLRLDFTPFELKSLRLRLAT